MIRRRHVALAGLAATVTVAFGTVLYSYSVLVTETAAGSEFSTGVLSTAFGGTILVGGGLAFLVGRIVDARGVRLMMGIGAILGGLGMVGLGMATANWQVIAVSWLLIGPCGALTLYEPAFVAVDQWFDPGERGRAIGILTVIGGLAGPIFLPLSAYLVEEFGWRQAATVLGLALALVGVGSAAWLLPSGGTHGDRHDREPVILRHLISDRRFVLYSLSVLLMYGAFQTVLLHRIALFEAGGFAIGAVSFWAGISGWMSFPGRYLGPVLGTGKRGAGWNAVTLVVLGATLGPMLISQSRGWMIIHFLAFGLVFGAILPMRAAVMGNWYSGPDFGRIMGIQWTAAAFTGAAAPALAGFSRDATGTYSPAIAIAIGALLMAALLVLGADRFSRLVEPSPARG